MSSMNAFGFLSCGNKEAEMWDIVWILIWSLEILGLEESKSSESTKLEHCSFMVSFILLYGECCGLLHNLLLSFVKEEIVKDKERIELLCISFELQNNQKNNSNIDIGETTRTYIKDLSPNEKVTFFEIFVNSIQP